MERTLDEKYPQLVSHRKNFVSFMKVGNFLKRAGMYDEALEHFAEARQHAYKLLVVKPLALSYCYLFIADVYQLKGKHARAARSYDKSVRYAIKQFGKHHKHIAWLRKREKACLSQTPDDCSCLLVSSLTHLGIDIALKEIELGGVIAAGLFAWKLANDLLALADIMRER